VFVLRFITLYLHFERSATKSPLQVVATLLQVAVLGSNSNR
jgi:hypothetical protein